jgi:gamma-glutamyl-gamma-aminobutyrate hydrolase PuuD
MQNKFMKLLQEKGFLILPGGADINPEIYGHQNIASYVSGYSLNRDSSEIKAYEKAVAEGKPIFGICRGMQLMSALNGLTLVQDMSQPYEHKIKIKNFATGNFSKEATVNNIHHQMVWTENKTETEDYIVLGYAEKISKKHIYNNKEGFVNCTIEPEIIYFPKTKSLGVQFHPEMMSDNEHYGEILSYLVDVINVFFNE